MILKNSKYLPKKSKLRVKSSEKLFELSYWFFLPIQDKDDGSGKIEFSEEEIKIISEKKCLLFEPVMLKHFVNSLVSVASSFNLNFKDEKIMNTQTVNGQDIKTK